MSWKKVLFVFLLVLAILIAGTVGFFLYQNHNAIKKRLEKSENRIEEIDKKLLVGVPYIPKEITLCGEPVSLDNPDVKKRLQESLTKEMNLHGGMVLNFLRSGSYLSLIEKKIKEYNLPSDVKYIFSVESDYNLRAASGKGAKGIAQFMSGTARKYGLKVDSYVDERRDPIKSIEAALRYLKDLYEEFGSWALAFAAYNTGENNIRDALKEQRVASYYDLVLSKETEEFVFRIIVRKLIMENPEKYGFSIDEDELYESYPARIKKIVDIKGKVKLADLAAKFGMDLREFKEINPHLIRDDLYGDTRKGRKYEIYVKP